MTLASYPERVVILGAGYTGLMAALRLARRTRHRRTRITLVNPAERFTERLRMHQIATGQELAHYSIPELTEGTGIEFVQGMATSLGAGARQVTVDLGGGQRELDWDYLIYAIGSGANTGTVPGADQHAFTLDTPTAARRLAGQLRALDGHGTVAVCGNGLTGIEAAAEIAESHPGLDVVLIGRGEPAAMMGRRARRYLLGALDRLGVEVRAGAEVTKLLPGGVELAGGEVIPVQACLWTTGFWASPLAADAGLRVDDRGRVVVDQALRSVSHPHAFAVGDSAAVRQPWGELHGTCQSGIPTAIHAADSLARLLAGRQPKRFRFGYIHQPVSLGRRDAVIQFARPDDTPRRLCLTGRAAVRYKEIVSSVPPPVYRMSRRWTLPAVFLAPRGGRATRLWRAPAWAGDGNGNGQQGVVPVRR
jgi:NADH dehydrogenase